MFAEPGRERAVTVSESPEVAVIAALDLEGRCLGVQPSAAGGCRLSLHRCGPGKDRAARAARAAAAQGAAGLVSWGLAGGLAQNVRPGDVLLPRRVLGLAGQSFAADPAWRSRLAAGLRGGFTVSEGTLLASGELLRGPAEKARAAAATGAEGVDMESAGIAEAAAAAGLPFVVLRVVADGHDDALPDGVERWIDAEGRRRLAPLVRTAVRPAGWPALCLLALRAAKARRTLEALARQLAPQSFLFAGDATPSPAQ
ncbi:MAG TPA: hypothetical protein VFY39_11040 [Gammaproteobacteria bacterium]|nr:hypothetical protein [Gammaproteobacteria bacterium]